VEIHFTSQDYWRGAVLAAIGSLILATPLAFVFTPGIFQKSALAIGISSALFWGTMAVLAFRSFWEIYYKYLYPTWMRYLSPLDTLFYATIGLGMWWLAIRLPGPSVLWFLLLGGCESLIEHLFGIYILHILEKVPALRGVAATPALVFAFFEYIVYWAITCWLAFALIKIIGLWRVI